MAFGRKLSRLWQVLFNRTRLDRELDEELRRYLDDLIEKKIRSGLDERSARRAAMIEMGGMTQVKDAVHRARVGAGIEALWQDIRLSGRSFFRKPGFALVTILTFALGIGATAAIFSVVNEVLVQPLPYKDAPQLAFVWGDASSIGYPRAPISGPEFNNLRERGTLFSEFASIWANTAMISGEGDPEQLRIGFVTSNFFDLLGAEALFGRTFDGTDARRGFASSILLSWPVFQRRYGGDPSIVGKNIIVNDQPTLVVGVMPADFRLLFPPDSAVPEDLEAWLPFDQNWAERLRRQNFLRVVGRMKPGVRLEEARQQVSQIAADISREYTDYGSVGRKLNLVGLQADGARDVRPGLLAVLAGVAILLLTACLNVANLFIARASSRTKETAVRLAIGASHRQIIRQCLAEGLFLAVVGGTAGVAIGELSLRALLALRPAALSRIGESNIDFNVLLFTAGIALFWGVLFSFAPMTEVMRTDVIGSVLGRARQLSSSRYRLRAGLVTLQVAMGLVLLVGAGLMIRTFVAIQLLDPGYTAQGMLSFRVALPDRYPSQIAVNAVHQRLQAELAALPGVAGVGSASHLPFDVIPNWGSPYFTKPDQDPATAPFADFRSVSPGYLEAIGATLIEGRFFTEADAPGSQPVVIVDDLVAKRSWPGESALGKRILIDPGVTGLAQNRRPGVVVGVVRHMRIRSLVEELTDQVYLPIRLAARPTSYVVRTEGDPSELAGAVRDAVRRIESQAAVSDMRPLEEYLIGARSVQRFTSLLAAAFAAVALLLAFIGVYGLITYSVNSRRYEFGVRLALGAQARQILGLVMREGIHLVVAGLVAGIAGSVVVATLLQSQLFGVTAFDIPTYAVAIAIIAIAGLLACWLPARKASLSNPMEVMRAQ